MASKITKRLICSWKGCDEPVFEEAAAFKVHVDKHIQEEMQTDLDNQPKDGTETEDKQKQEEDEPFAKKAKLNEEMTNGVDIDIGRRIIISLAIEVWLDVLGFIKRIHLARTVSLTNRHIYQMCWPRMHGNKVEVRHICEITIAGRERFDRDLPPKALVQKINKLMPVPSCPPPPYISGFYRIIIKFLDQEVLAFFTRILPCLSKGSVSIALKFDGSNAKQCALLDHLLNTLKDGLSKNKLDAYSSLSNIPYLPDIDNKMQKISLHLTASAFPLLILMKMLASPRADGKQRVICISPDEYLIRKLLITIKEDFRLATQRLPQPFYIYFYGRNLDMERSLQTNAKTDEQLTIMPYNDDDRSHLWEVCRHPRGQHEQWAEDGRKRVKSASPNESLTSIRVDLT